MTTSYAKPVYNSPVMAFDVTTALHDDVKTGPGYPRIRSRVLVSAIETTYEEAVTTAATLAVAVHGGMAIEVLPRY